MCELFGLSANKEVLLTNYLETFYSHSDIHCNGWGMVLLDGGNARIEREPVKALNSAKLRGLLDAGVTSSNMLAHIRQATIGEVNLDNTHPFSGYDVTGRRWIFMHNGSIFESSVLSPYQYKQQGTTDSERIFLYLLDEVNKLYNDEPECADLARFELVERIITDVVVPDNKVNLMIYDGEYLYVHKNEAKSLYMKEIDGAVIISTQALDDADWTEFPQNRLLIYRRGELIYTGAKHNNTYVMDEERMRLLFLAYSQL